MEEVNFETSRLCPVIFTDVLKEKLCISSISQEVIVPV